MVREKIAFSVVTYTVLFDACAQSGDMDRAPALLTEMPTKGIEPNLVTYSTILKGYCMANRMEDAFDLMTGMTQTTKMLPDKIMYNHLFEGCARQGLFARGMNLLAQMREARVQPDNFTLSVLVKLIGRKGKLHQAFDLCAELSTLHHVQLNIYVYNNLVHACVVHHDFPRAISVIKEMVSANIWPDARTYTPLLRALITARDLQGAMNLLNTVTGQPGGLPSLSDVDASALTPKDGLPIAIVSEVLSGIACHNAELASKMAQNLKCLEQYTQLDTKPRPGHRTSRYSHKF
jgi:pentatricopeptide repeat protein